VIGHGGRHEHVDERTTVTNNSNCNGACSNDANDIHSCNWDFAKRSCIISSEDRALHSCSSDLLSYAVGRGSSGMGSRKELVWGTTQRLAICKVGMG